MPAKNYLHVRHPHLEWELEFCRKLCQARHHSGPWWRLASAARRRFFRKPVRWPSPATLWSRRRRLPAALPPRSCPLMTAARALAERIAEKPQQSVRTNAAAATPPAAHDRRRRCNRLRMRRRIIRRRSPLSSSDGQRAFTGKKAGEGPSRSDRFNKVLEARPRLAGSHPAEARQGRRLHEAIQEITTRKGLDRAWTRPGLERKTRSMLTRRDATALLKLGSNGNRTCQALSCAAPPKKRSR